MRWDRGHESDDVIDERGRRMSAGGVNPGALFMLFRFAARFGWKGILVATLLVGGVLYLQSQPVGLVADKATNDEQRQFVSSILDDVQTTFGAPGDFAEAYVIAHEVGHHVQHILGIDDKVPKGRTALGASGASVRLELQADCYAGVWAASAGQRNLLDVGDLDEGLTAAAAIGDDRLQRQEAGTVSPESFSHGTSAQRSRWLRKGYTAGRLDACDTFGATEL